MADSSLSITDTSSSGGIQAIAAAACNMQRDGTDDIEVDDAEVLDPAQEVADAFKEYKFTVEDLPEFSEFSVKIIMRLNTDKGPAFVPKIEDLRCIASA